MYDLKKVSKTLADFEGLEPDYEQKLEFYDTKKNHNKFWHIWVYGNLVVRNYGRHGSKGQTVVHETWSKGAAKNAARDLMWSKEEKGYKPDTTTILDHIARKID